jgi:predicted RNase H-like HicB family nuclease
VAANPAGGFTATVPDIPGCAATDPDIERVLTRIHLVLEGFISDSLIDGQELPSVRLREELRQDPNFAADQLFDIHINLTHLAAVAKHQALI